MNYMFNNYKVYDNIGVFSTCISELNEKMWDEYAAKGTGYCLGFHLDKLVSSLNSISGIVNYSDEVVSVNAFDIGLKAIFTFMVTKFKIWDYEQEFRFVDPNITQGKSRVNTVPKSNVSQVVIGANTSKEDQTKIINATRKVYGTELPIYKVIRDGDKLIKTPI